MDSHCKSVSVHWLLMTLQYWHCRPRQAASTDTIPSDVRVDSCCWLSMCVSVRAVIAFCLIFTWDDVCVSAWIVPLNMEEPEQ